MIDILLLIIKVLIAATLFISGAADMKEALNYSKWSQTKGTVKSAALKHIDDVKNPWGHDEAQISYRYTVKGKEYTSEQIIIGGNFGADHNYLLARHKHSPQTVFYDPNHPEKAALEADPNWFSIWARIISGLLFVPLTRDTKKPSSDRRTRTMSARLTQPEVKLGNISWFWTTAIILLPLLFALPIAAFAPTWAAHFEFLALNMLALVILILGVTAITANGLIDRDLRAGRFTQAEKSLRRMVFIQKAMSPVSADYAKSLTQLAMVCRQNKKYVEAVQYAKDAIAVATKGGTMMSLALASSANQNGGELLSKAGPYNFYTLLEAEATQELAHIYAAEKDEHNTELACQRTISLLQTIKAQTSTPIALPSPREQGMEAKLFHKLTEKEARKGAVKRVETCAAMMTDAYELLTDIYEKRGASEKMEQACGQLLRLRREASLESQQSALSTLRRQQP